MPSVGMQMPGMYLRGSLCNVTMRNLTYEQQLEVDDIVKDLKDDPSLQAARVEFRNALRFTIKGDYLDQEAADQEYQISLWRAVVATKYGWGKHPPCEETLTDPKQRKKFFQTWVFNYLRQILNENKRLKKLNNNNKPKSTWEVVSDKIRLLLSDDLLKCTIKNNTFSIRVDLFALPLKTIQEIHKLRLAYFNNGVRIKITDSMVEVINMEQSQSQAFISTTSIYNKDEDNNSYRHDMPAFDSVGFEDPDTIGVLYENLSEDAQRVLKIIVDPPADYQEKYGNKSETVKRYIAEYLELTPRQVKDVWSELKLCYTSIIGMPEDC